MNRIIILIIALIFLNQCSLNENSRIWKDKENKLEAQKSIKKVFLEDKKITTEFNQELKLDLSKIKFNDKITDDKNNYGSQNYEGLINKIGNYKFSKFEDANQLNFKPIFLDSSLFSLSFHIREFSFKEHWFRKISAIIKIIILFTQISIQSFFSLSFYI